MNIKTKDFHEVLARCSKFVSSREFDSTGFKCFRFENNVIQAFAKDKGIWYRMPDFNFGESSFFIDAEFLLSAIANLLVREDYDMEYKKSNLHFVKGNFKATVKSSFPEEAFNFPDLPINEKIKELPEQFFWFVDKISFAAMRDPVTFSKFSGIFVDKGTFYATNNILIAKYVSDLDIDVFTMPDVLDEALGGEGAENYLLKGYYFDSDKFWLKFEKKESKDFFLAFANTLEKPLDVVQLREWFEECREEKPACQYVQDHVLEALRLIEPWTDTTSKRMVLTLDKDKMTLASNNKLGEAITREVRCEYSGEPLSFIFMFDEFKKCIERMKKFSPYVFGTRCRLYFTEGGPLELLLISLLD